MLKRRKILLAVSVLLTAGSLGSTLGYALHLRSRALRERIAAGLSERMRLDVQIGQVQPLSFSSRRLGDIALWLPERRVQVGECRTAVWHREAAEGPRRYSLEIADGWLLVGAGHWGTGDYQRLLRSGFAHDFPALGISEINVQRIDLRWSHPMLSLVAPAASGVIFFEPEGRGRAVLSVERINETPVDDPIHISASFTPGAAMSFHRVEMRMGEIPIAALALDRLAGGRISQGVFAGQIVYREAPAATEGWTLGVTGAVSAARLEELTRRVIGGPFKGQVDVSIDDAIFIPGQRREPLLHRLQFRGRLQGLELGDFASVLREPELNGRMDLSVEQADFEVPDLKYLRVSGQASEVSLRALTRLLGYGVITGRLEVRIHALAIVDNQVQWADVDLIAMPPSDGAAYIEKSALARAAKEIFGTDLGLLLPERVEYARLGAKLLLDKEGLRIRGTHGEGNRTILTVKLLGREVAVLRQPEKVYPVSHLIELARERLRDYEVEDFIGWWTRQADRREGE